MESKRCFRFAPGLLLAWQVAVLEHHKRSVSGREEGKEQVNMDIRDLGKATITTDKQKCARKNPANKTNFISI